MKILFFFDSPQNPINILSMTAENSKIVATNKESWFFQKAFVENHFID